MDKEQNEVFGRFLERENLVGFEKASWLTNGERLKIIESFGNEYVVERILRDCEENKDFLRTTIPKNYILKESGMCYFTEGDNFPRLGEFSVNNISIDCYDAYLYGIFDINVVITERLGSGIWLLIDEEGDRYYYYHSSSNLGDNYIKCFLGRAYGDRPRKGDNFGCYALKDKIKLRLDTDKRNVELVHLDYVEVAESIGIMEDSCDELIFVTGFKDSFFNDSERTTFWGFVHLTE